MKIPRQMVWKHQLQNTLRSFAGVQRHMESCFLQIFWKEVRIANIKPFRGMLLEEVGFARVQNVNGPSYHRGYWTVTFFRRDGRVSL